MSKRLLERHDKRLRNRLNDAYSKSTTRSESGGQDIFRPRLVVVTERARASVRGRFATRYWRVSDADGAAMRARQ